MKRARYCSREKVSSLFRSPYICDDIWKIILTYLCLFDLFNLAMTNQQLNRLLSKNEEIWTRELRRITNKLHFLPKTWSSTGAFTRSDKEICLLIASCTSLHTVSRFILDACCNAARDFRIDVSRIGHGTIIKPEYVNWENGHTSDCFIGFMAVAIAFFSAFVPKTYTCTYISIYSSRRLIDWQCMELLFRANHNFIRVGVDMNMQDEIVHLIPLCYLFCVSRKNDLVFNYPKKINIDLSCFYSEMLKVVRGTSDVMDLPLAGTFWAKYDCCNKVGIGTTLSNRVYKFGRQLDTPTSARVAIKAVSLFFDAIYWLRNLFP